MWNEGGSTPGQVCGALRRRVQRSTDECGVFMGGSLFASEHRQDRRYGLC